MPARVSTLATMFHATLFGLCLALLPPLVVADGQAAGQTAPAAALSQLTVQNRFATYSGREVPAKHTRGRHIFEFQASRGAILPSQVKPVFGEQIVTDEKSFTLTLDRWHRFQELAGPLTESVRKLGFRMTPQDARVSLMRARTFFMSGSKMGRTTELRDEQGGSHLLAYFDRPCRIEGTGLEKEQQVTVDVTISGPGFHLLSYEQGKDGHQRLVSAGRVPELFLTTLFDY